MCTVDPHTVKQKISGALYTMLVVLVLGDGTMDVL